MKNGQNNDSTTIHNIQCSCDMVKDAKNSKICKIFYVWYCKSFFAVPNSAFGLFSTAGLALSNRTSGTTKDSNTLQPQTLIILEVNLVAHKSYKCTALVESFASLNMFYNKLLIGWDGLYQLPIQLKSDL